MCLSSSFSNVGYLSSLMKGLLRPEVSVRIPGMDAPLPSMNSPSSSLQAQKWDVITSFHLSNQWRGSLWNQYTVWWRTCDQWEYWLPTGGWSSKIHKETSSGAWDSGRTPQPSAEALEALITEHWGELLQTLYWCSSNILLRVFSEPIIPSLGHKSICPILKPHYLQTHN